MDEQTIRVLIADDDAVMLASLADVVASDGSFEVVGTARDADEAIALAESRRPDVALVDVRMPAGGGQRVVEELRRRAPEIRVLAHTVVGERESVVGMLHGGAVGYLLKGTASTEEILSAIQRAARGQPSLSSEVMSGLVADLAGHLERDELQASERRAKAQRLARVIAGPGRRIVYQPIVELAGHAMVGLEALSRFETEDEPWPVDRWFSEAAAIGLGTELELASSRAALADLSRFPPGTYLSLNVSHRTVESQDLLFVLDAVDASRVVVEITEHEAVADYDGLIRVLEPVRERGTRVAIDDLGAGFASLRHILSIDPDIIKLDVSLVRGIDSDSRRHALATALVSFAREMGIGVIAEGIETFEEHIALQSLGIGFGQGYFIARPAPLEEFVT